MSDFVNENEDLKTEKTKKSICVQIGIKNKKIFYGGCAIGIALLVIAVLILPKVVNPDGGKVTTISESSLEKVIEINDLSTLDYTYNAIAEVYDEDGTTLKYHVAYEGIVTAGIDITKVDIAVNEEEKKIIITLPNAEIQNVSVNMGTLSFIFEKEKYETETISAEGYKASLDDLNKKAHEEETLLSMAKDNAIDAMNALIAPWVEQINETYVVEVK